MTGVVRVAELLTHYPLLTQTFLRREIETVAGAGLEIHPFAINAPARGDVATEADQREHERTFYVKAQPKRHIVAALGRITARQPGAVPVQLGRAMRPAGADAKALLWRAFYFAEAALVWDECRRRGIRHIHAQFGGVTSTVAMLTAGIGCHLDGPGTWTWSFTVHGFHDFVNERDFGLSAKLASASFAVCICDYLRSQLLRVADASDWHKVHVVRCGIDLDEFAMRPSRPVGDVPTILSVGRLSAEKGHGVLLDAVRALHERGVECRLVLVGSGPMGDELRRRAHVAGLANRVELTGALEPHLVRQRLESADVFCLPSFAEGLPISIMEAMAVGVPVVSTYVGGIPELVRDGVTGRCVPAGRADHLADAIEGVLRRTVERDGYITAARAAVEAHHEQSAAASAMRALLLAAAGGARPAAAQ